MAIRFCCSQCGQPIEVDNEHAGQTAACPYCRHVMSVPRDSTYSPEAAVPARPLSGVAGTQPEAMGPLTEVPPAVAAAAARQHGARTYGGYALICTALALILIGVAVVRAGTLYFQSGKLTGPTPPTASEMGDLQLQAAKDPLVVGPTLGAVFFALVGLVLAIVSLAQARSGNWRGLTAAIICGLFLLCYCGGTMVSALAGFRMPAQV
jgi:DNA-directed RNA polymerase subunit RPC12/RpoP